jgi:hypothetical protein
MSWRALSAARPALRRSGSRSIRRRTYLYEHMFPSRASRAFTALLEVADAILAPLPLDLDAADVGEGAGMAAPRCIANADGVTEAATGAEAAHESPRHPHARRATVSHVRRPAPAPATSPCLSPLRPATAAAQTAPRSAA